MLPSMLSTCWSAFASTIGGTRGGRSNVTSFEEATPKLRDVLATVLQSSDAAAVQRADAIRASAVHTYDALPKNDLGRLAPKAVRYLVQSYFAKEHGWLINGLEPHGNGDNVTDVHDVQILEDKAPAVVESLLEAKRSNRGLTLDDAVALMATLEQLIFNEGQLHLHAAYASNGFAETEALGESDVHDVLTSFLIITKYGDSAQPFQSDARAHLQKKARMPREAWLMILENEQQAFNEFKLARQQTSNHSDTETYHFRDVSDIVSMLVEGYGKYQQIDCGWIKRDLVSLDPDGTGRVPLGSFYSHPPNPHFSFSESPGYLAEIGALDETDGKKVRIANYVAGPSNCVAESTYFSVCCLTGCENLMAQLEAEVRAPTASPEDLLAVVSKMSSPTVKAPRQLPDGLITRLHLVAQHHDGVVPIHGRLFSQWLHHAFPYECPFPQIIEDSSVLMPGYWDHPAASLEDRTMHIESTTNDRKGDGGMAATCDADMPWIETEVLHVQEGNTSKLPGTNMSFSGSDALRMAIQCALLSSIALVSLRVAVSGVCALRGGSKEKHELPI